MDGLARDAPATAERVAEEARELAGGADLVATVSRVLGGFPGSDLEGGKEVTSLQPAF